MGKQKPVAGRDTTFPISDFPFFSPTRDRPAPQPSPAHAQPSPAQHPSPSAQPGPAQPSPAPRSQHSPAPRPAQMPSNPKFKNQVPKCKTRPTLSVNTFPYIRKPLTKPRTAAQLAGARADKGSARDAFRLQQRSWGVSGLRVEKGFRGL